MDFLQDWVTQIIIFLLIAMFVELLLPQSNMQKYIKFAVGLILMLIFLQPIFQLFNADAHALIENSIESISDQRSLEINNQIENEKREIQASQRAYILNQMVVQLKDQVEGELIEKYGVKISDITFTFLEEINELNWEELDEIQVKLEQTTETTGREVEEVVIDFNEEPKEEIPFDEIKADLSSFWEISEDQIKLIWEGGDAI
jgi:stage III sporulation protein AF